MKLNWTTPKITSPRAIHAWTAPYAADVHNGQTFISGARLPARPWTEPVIYENDIAEMVAAQYRAGRSLSSAFIATNQELGRLFDESMEMPIWQWPNTTRRQNSEVVGSPRNIIDEGTLIDSRVLEFVGR